MGVEVGVDSPCESEEVSVGLESSPPSELSGGSPDSCESLEESLEEPCESEESDSPVPSDSVVVLSDVVVPLDVLCEVVPDDVVLELVVLEVCDEASDSVEEDSSLLEEIIF